MISYPKISVGRFLNNDVVKGDCYGQTNLRIMLVIMMVMTYMRIMVIGDDSGYYGQNGDIGNYGDDLITI